MYLITDTENEVLLVAIEYDSYDDANCAMAELGIDRDIPSAGIEWFDTDDAYDIYPQLKENV